MKHIIGLLMLGSLPVFADVNVGDHMRMDRYPYTLGEVTSVSDDLVSIKLDPEATSSIDHSSVIVSIAANTPIFSNKPARETLNIFCEAYGFGEGVRSKSSSKRNEGSRTKVMDVITCIRNP